VVWGSVTELTSLKTAMLAASAGVILATVFTRRWPVSGNDAMDHTPSRHWRKPEPVIAITPEQGPVLITVRYTVDSEHQPDFLKEMKLLGRARQRDGATFWNIFEDARQPGHFVETYVVSSWLDHLRQHERITRQDAQVQARIKTLLRAGSEPEVSHFVTPVSP
jgi:hypothetical protein